MMANIHHIIGILLLAGARNICGNSLSVVNIIEFFYDEKSIFIQVIVTLMTSKGVCLHQKKDVELLKWKIHVLLVVPMLQLVSAYWWDIWKNSKITFSNSFFQVLGHGLLFWAMQIELMKMQHISIAVTRYSYNKAFSYPLDTLKNLQFHNLQAHL